MSSIGQFGVIVVIVWFALGTTTEAAQPDEGKALERLSSDLKDADARLNRVYKEILLRLHDRRRIRLQEAQRAWIPYRDKVCSFIESIDSVLAEKRCLLELTSRRVAELEEVENQINPDPMIVPGEVKEVSWPNSLGGEPERSVPCADTTLDLRGQVQDRLGKNHPYTTACQITDAIYLLLDENGNNPLGVLDVTRRGGPITINAGPWVDRLIKDKSRTLHVVSGASGMTQGLLTSALHVVSTKTWQSVLLVTREWMDGRSFGCPHKGDYGYDAVKQSVQATHKYSDQNGDGFEDIVIEVTENDCTTSKSKTYTKVFLATENGFKEASAPVSRGGGKPKNPGRQQ